MVAQPFPPNDDEIKFDWKKILAQIPGDAHEALVYSRFVEPLLEELGFNKQEWLPQFPTGKGADRVDYAARKNSNNDIFEKNKTNPDLLIEAKGRQTVGGAKIHLATDTPQYKEAQTQIKKYLLSPNCQTAQWGIITNADYIQLFHRHGKVVFPATQNYLIKKDNIEQIIIQFKRLINQPPIALSICVYNDKGGVGKTTTVANLASVLGILKKKVLVIDFDPQQGDLTASLGKGEGQVKLSDALMNKNISIDNVIQPFWIQLKKSKLHIFDFISTDSNLEQINTNQENMAKTQGSQFRLKKLIEPLLYKYDYIIFDSPTNWSFFSQSCVYASDVVLIPTNANNFASLKNAKKVIKQYIPEIQQQKIQNNEYGICIALPIFFSVYDSTDAQLQTTHKELTELITTGKKGDKIIIDTNLCSLFFPKYSPGNPDKSIFTIRQYAIVANAGFLRCPSVLTNKIARKYYEDLAKEYFIYE